MPSHPAVLQRLLDISLHLNSATDLDDLLTYIIEAVTHLLDCEAGSLLLFDEPTGTLRFVASTGSSHAELARIPVPLNDSIAGHVYVSGDTVIQQNVQDSDKHYDAVGAAVSFQTRSLLAVPLSIEDRTIGVLEALNRRAGDFTEDDEAVLLAFATQAALAIRNARQLEYIESAYDRLQSFEQFRNEFLALASHELRTPLSVLTQVLDILGTEGNEMQKAFTADAQQAAGRLHAIIDSMSQLEALRLGTVRTQRHAVHLAGVIDRVGELFGPLCRKQDVRLTVALGSDGLSVWSDEDRLLRIVGNAVRNSLAATPAGGSIHVTCHETDDRMVAISVADTGVGIAADALARVFDEYYQVEHHLTRERGGLGIGLTVARQLASVDDGVVDLQSDGAGKGAVFTLTLPARAAS